MSEPNKTQKKLITKNLQLQPHIFFTTAPFQIQNSGDFDYTQMLDRTLNQIGYCSEFITSKSLNISGNCCLYQLQNLIKINKVLWNAKNDFQKFQKAYKQQFAPDMNRKNYINTIKTYILSKSKLINKKPILNIQMRVPETGFVFMPNDIKELKQQGISVILTCHQYKLYSCKKHLQAIYHPYFAQADLIYFFNQKDLKNASKHANKTKLPQNCNKIFKHKQYDLLSKSLLTQVPPTIPYRDFDINSILARKPNIISFGMIRPGKGFEQILQIAKYIVNNKNLLQQKLLNSKNLPRILIVGYPSSSSLIKDILQIKFGKIVMQIKQIDQILGKIQQNSVKQIKKQNIQNLRLKICELTSIHQEKAPIDLYLDVDSQDMPRIFAQAKYAIKFDEKGWANNASSHINALANGLIIFTGWGICTDTDVLPQRIKNDKVIPQGKFYNSILLPKNKYGLTMNQKLSLQEQNDTKIGKYKHFKYIDLEDGLVKRQNLFNAQSIMEQIIKRQNNIQQNKMTLMKAKEMFDKKFTSKTVATQFYQNLILNIQ